MSLKRLPNDVQSLLCASAQVNSFKRAIEEFIYNSLDAKSTSIAIRIHIQESTIQVIDNGFGITKNDFKVIGHRHMTSKLADVTTLKAAPKNYGYRGEFLANIITVSQIVKVTSRHDSTEETWAKTFINGKEKKFAQMTTRPTKGTTIDIKGFLYNLNIQKIGINSINELQNIKLFLEQLSLLHNHISLSLRDDSQNEIVFKIHKKRDIYQTLSTLFNISKVDVLELQVEKSQYKVKGLIGKTDKNLDLHWIYLNGKFIHIGSKLHTLINQYFKKCLHIKDRRPLKSKKNNNDHELFEENIPFYFIFVTCPYIDYDISYTPKQLVIEFKNWEHVNKLLEKLVKFYAGDLNLKEIKTVRDECMNKEQILNTKINKNTREQVKKIMDKILGSNTKKLEISQLQNGIKGKMVKRKVKKKKTCSVIIPKLFRQNNNDHNNEDYFPTKNITELNSDHDFGRYLTQQTVDDPAKNKEQSTHNLIQQTVDNSDKNKEQNVHKHRNAINKNKIPGTKKSKAKEMQVHKNKNQFNANISSLAKQNCKTKMRQHTKNKHKKIKVHNNEFKCIKSTDSVCKRSKTVAQKVDDFLQNQVNKRNVIMNQLETTNRKEKRNKMLLQTRNCKQKNEPVQSTANKYIIERYIMNKINTKSYKTTYDLVKTVLENQQELISTAENNMSEDFYKKFHKRNATLHYMPKIFKQYAWTNKHICGKYSDISDKKEISRCINDIPGRHKSYEYEEKFSESYSFYGQKQISNIVTNISEKMEFIDEDENMCGLNQNVFCTRNETSYCTFSGPLTVLTYDSHQYHKKEVPLRNGSENCYTINKRQNIRFITKESTDNFVITNDLKNRLMRPLKVVPKKLTKSFDLCMKQTIDESYAIDYTKSHENNYSPAHNYTLPKSVDFIKDNDYNKNATINYEPVSPTNYLNPEFGNTYTIDLSSINKNIISGNMKRNENLQSSGLHETYSVHDPYSEVDDINNEPTKSKDIFSYKSKNFNIVFVSKSQRSETVPSNSSMIVEPINVCETVFDEIGSNEKESAVSFNENNQLNDSLYGNMKYVIDEQVENEHNFISQGNDDITEKISHHFSSAIKTHQPHLIDNNIADKVQDPVPTINNQNEINKLIISGNQLNLSTEYNFNAENNYCNFEINFNLKSRPRFVPKGMSQIFENCHTKTVCDYVMDKDYFQDSIYNNFANNVHVNTEIYEPLIQNVEDFTTKNIHKFQNKIKKDNASLIFDETSLKTVKVLGQADCKFIVAIMRDRCDQSKEAPEYLILFDQHAVHERIRLEKNLADYFNKDRWTSVIVDNIILKMSKDEILYLHNYKDKFTQLGLQWNILNDNEVTVHSIPEAILGKNPREGEKVIKAVKNLIVEEIHVIKLQKGCVSLYPKAIMDLVFSEACRYAIKFGDPLSKSDCIDLLNVLSTCKTPFQCAHGRPVMAVITDIIADKREYKINMKALSRFRQSNTSKV